MKNLDKSVSIAQGPNNEVLQNTYCLGGATVTYTDTSLSSASDPFASKTNKYAESKVIRVACADKGIHIVFGATAPTADANDYFIPANTAEYFLIDPTKPYVSIIENAASAKVYVTELY